MSTSIELKVARRLYLIRQLLLLTVDDIFNILQIPPSTLRRLENGSASAIVKRIDKLCYLYQIDKEELYSLNKQLPDWKLLRRRVLSAHRNNDLVLQAINKIPSQKKAIQYRVLQSSFMNDFQSTQNIIDHIQSRYNWTFDYNSILMALDSLVYDNMLEVKHEKSSPQKFRKSRKILNDDNNIFELLTIQLEEIVRVKSINYVTPAYGKMAGMVISLKDGPIRRKDIYSLANYGNLYKNHQKSLKVLETLELVEMTESKSTSSKQMYRLTGKGRELLKKVGVKGTGL
ncbi:hypothetical protein SAMN05216436_1164 [bacterium A37T11]|nr:hypothetical protein SAMN05216436_1164 [bacterium A37T11]